MSTKPVISYLWSKRNSIKISWNKINHDCSYIVQIEDRVYNWITKYWGLDCSAEIKGLGPEEIYNIRVGHVAKIEDHWSDEVVWSDIYVSATKFDLPWSFYLFQDVERSSVENIVNFIQERNWELDVLNRQGETALMKAIRLHNGLAVKLLINGGANLNEQPWPLLRSPLMVASYHGNLAAAQLLCSNGANWELKDVNGMSAVHYAVENSQIDLLKFAVENEVNIDDKDHFEWTPLMRGIIMKCDFEILSFLVGCGANIKTEDKFKRDCVTMAKIVGLEHVDELFNIVEEKKEEIKDGEKSDDESDMDMLAEHSEVIQWILEEGDKEQINES